MPDYQAGPGTRQAAMSSADVDSITRRTRLVCRFHSVFDNQRTAAVFSTDGTSTQALMIPDECKLPAWPTRTVLKASIVGFEDVDEGTESKGEASSSVFGTTELLEHISSFLPLRDLYQTQRVCSIRKECIGGSPHLQARMYLKLALERFSLVEFEGRWTEPTLLDPILNDTFVIQSTRNVGGAVPERGCEPSNNKSHAFGIHENLLETASAETVDTADGDSQLPARTLEDAQGRPLQKSRLAGRGRGPPRTTTNKKPACVTWKDMFISSSPIHNLILCHPDHKGPFLRFHRARLCECESFCSLRKTTSIFMSVRGRRISRSVAASNWCWSMSEQGNVSTVEQGTMVYRAFKTRLKFVFPPPKMPRPRAGGKKARKGTKRFVRTYIHL